MAQNTSVDDDEVEKLCRIVAEIRCRMALGIATGHEGLEDGAALRLLPSENGWFLTTKYSSAICRCDCDYYGSAPRHPHVPALTAEERELYEAIGEIAGSPELYLDMDLRPGDIQLLSNHTQLHSRTGYEDWDDPEQRRHLLRLWISLPESQPQRLRLLTVRAYLGLVGTMLSEPVRERLAA